MRGKRIKQFILILCMVCLFGMNVQAEDVYTEFHVDNQKGKAGDVVTVPVEFNTGQEVGGFQISIYYDKEVQTGGTAFERCHGRLIPGGLQLDEEQHLGHLFRVDGSGDPPR